jgi:SAM-dependent methyltransferase
MVLRSNYLSSGLPPGQYYEIHGNEYENPHSQGIVALLSLVENKIQGKTILDLGCGDGIVTKVLSKSMKNSQFIGIDNSEVMLERYKKTGFELYKINFGEELPQADTAIACYSLHLCEESRLAQMGIWLTHAGVKKIHIISPIKRPKEIFGYALKEHIKYFRGKDLSQIHFKTFEVI